MRGSCCFTGAYLVAAAATRITGVCSAAKVNCFYANLEDGKSNSYVYVKVMT